MHLRLQLFITFSSILLSIRNIILLILAKIGAILLAELTNRTILASTRATLLDSEVQGVDWRSLLVISEVV